MVPPFEMGIEINFSWETFIWDSEASDKAHVHCVIIGFSMQRSVGKRLFDRDGVMSEVQNTNGYLSPAPNVFIRSRGKAIDGKHKKMTQGSKPVDGANLILAPDEYDMYIKKNPQAAEYLLPYIGAREFINGKKRYVFWLKELGEKSFGLSPELDQRLEAVKETRAKSPIKEFQDYASRPWLFVQDRQPKTNYLVLPRTTSGRRIYLPLGFNEPGIITSDKLIIIPDASLYDFGLLSSLFHAAWMRVVSGRLKSDYEYSSGVYNNMAYPDAICGQRQIIEQAAQAANNDLK